MAESKKDKAYSAINIGGLAIGIMVTMLIELWIFIELSFNTNHGNYDRIAQVFQHQGTVYDTNFFSLSSNKPISIFRNLVYLIPPLIGLCNSR